MAKTWGYIQYDSTQRDSNLVCHNLLKQVVYTTIYCRRVIIKYALSECVSVWGDKCIQHSCCGVCDLVIKRNTLGQAAGYLTYSIPLSTMGATICRAHMPLLWTLTIDCTKNVMAEWTEERVDGAIHSRALWSTCKRGAAGRTRRRTTRRKKNATTTNAATTTTMVEKSRHLFLGPSTWRASCCRC